MQAEQVRKLTDNAVDRLISALEGGKSEAFTTYLAAMAKFHRYSWGNVLLIVSQRPEATHVAGFNTWKTLNRFVRKGEKGIVIMAPMMIRTRDDTEQAAEADGSKRPAVLRFRGVYVFDVTQTEGEPLPVAPHVEGDPGVFADRLRAFVTARGITLTHATLRPGMSGMSAGGAVTLAAGLAPAEEFSTLAHELAHEMLHHGDGVKLVNRKTRETEAEAVAFIVCTAVGLATGTASSDYIQLYRGDRDTLTASLERIQKTAATIIAAMHDGEQGTSSSAC